MNEDMGLDSMFEDRYEIQRELTEAMASQYDAYQEMMRDAAADAEAERKAILHEAAVVLQAKQAEHVEQLCAEWAKYPSFFAQTGRKPIAHRDYDPDGTWTGDDVEYLNGTGTQNRREYNENNFYGMVE